MINCLGPAFEDSQIAFRLMKVLQEHRNSENWIFDSFAHADEDIVPSLQVLEELCLRIYRSRRNLPLQMTVFVWCGYDSIA